MRTRLYVATYGCQMNERDSEEVLGMLTAQGYQIASQPEGADVILLNTCSVREHAEERAFGKMGELSVLKRERPELVLGIIGCMAKLQQETIFKRLPKVDLVAGPAELYDLPYLLAEIQEKRQRLAYSVQRRADRTSESEHLNAERCTLSARTLAVDRAFRPLEQKPAGDYRRPGVGAFVTIMEGCDKSCTYCIVPKTRGQEVSRPAEEIIREVQRLVEAGYQDITLLGQNVNSYGKRFPDGSGFKGPLGRLRMLEDEPESLLDFPMLLRMIDASLRGQTPVGVRPLPRLRFTTSHPFDAHVRLFDAMRECGSVCDWLHLPVQSGSNRLLRAMRRGYTHEAYLEKIASLRERLPDVSLSTDIIIGFPGETDEDFNETVRLMHEVEYDSAYIFKYSPRPGTDAAAKEDDVPVEVKNARNQTLLALQDEISQKRLQRFEGRTVEVLIEGAAKRPGQMFGRTRGNHGVVIEGGAELAERLTNVRITRALPHTLFGEVLTEERPQSTVRGPQ
ncbi:MAG: tRNA (N6-isopentenyl adenosine(37)-C2)-methylthiotransferase MiaB [Candidatus Omnitrophica bacterium]|nr:tRNA (N6-isopentenyl adenosine(37)-C2)-methylthiotransferase MiaB [Candidatus Omnitrophota bacterium]